MHVVGTGRYLARGMLGNAAWFVTWDSSLIDDLFKRCQLREYEKGELIYKDGGPREMIFIVTGSAWIYLCRGKSIAKFGLYYPAKFIGLTQLNSEVAENLDIYEFRAAEKVLALSIPVEFLIQILDSKPFLWRSVAKEAILTQRECVRLMLMLHTGTTKKRIAWAIFHFRSLQKYSQHGVNENGVMISQEELSILIQSSRPHVNRALKELESEGILRLNYKYIKVTNEALFEAFIKSS